jgi:hypothetical protein
MSMSLVTAVFLCAVAIAVGIALVTYGFRRTSRGGKK